MKTLLALLLSCFAAQASSIITATIGVTNVAGTTNGNTITVNGDTRFWTNSVYAPATQILIGTNRTLAASALLNAAAIYPFSGLALNQTASTNITLRAAPDAPLAVTLSAGWGTVSFTTNTITEGWLVHLPIELESAAQQTNIASALAAAINSSANTNPVVVTYTPQSGHATNADRTITATNAPDGYPLLSTNSSLHAALLTGTLGLNAPTSTIATNAPDGYPLLSTGMIERNFSTTNNSTTLTNIIASIAGASAGGPHVYTVYRANDTYDVLTNDEIVLMNVYGVTVTLPDASTVPGREYTIVNGSTGGTDTVATTSSQNIVGIGTSYSLPDNKYLRVVAWISSWFVTGQN